MKKLLTKLLCLLLVILLVPSFFSCGGPVSIEFDFDVFWPDYEELRGRFDISDSTDIESNCGGYAISTSLKDDNVYKVSSVAEANDIIGRAIMAHIHEFTIDYSEVEDYSPENDRTLAELTNHVVIGMRYYKANPKIVEFEISYLENAASEFANQTEENDPMTVLPGNLLARLASIPDSARRASDFDAFPIDSVEQTWAVYNSEELWWALSRGYRPTFPTESSKAETFYLEAKRILRQIVTDAMTDYEKLLSIYEYLTWAVEYDYDTYYGDDDGWHRNTSFYLEGVFEASRAVCDGKAKAFVLFAAIEGIECVRDFGKNLVTGVGHAWNYVKLDGLWYLVDTTAGDAFVDGEIGEFFGDSAEFTDYISFLFPIGYYKNEYRYSTVWTSITEGAPDAWGNDRHFERGLYGGSEYDFIIDKPGELSEICSLAVSVADNAPFSLTVKYEYFVDVHTVLDSAVTGKGYEYAVFVLDDTASEYLILFKPISE